MILPWLLYHIRDHVIGEMFLAAFKKVVSLVVDKLVKKMFNFRIVNLLDFISPFKILAELERTVMLILVVTVSVCVIGLTVYGLKKSLPA